MFLRHQRTIFISLLIATVTTLTTMVTLPVHIEAALPAAQSEAAISVVSNFEGGRSSDDLIITTAPLASEDIPVTPSERPELPDTSIQLGGVSTLPVNPQSTTAPVRAAQPDTTTTLVAELTEVSIDTELRSAVIDPEHLLAEAVPVDVEPQPVSAQAPVLDDQESETYAEACSPDRERLSPYSTYESVITWSGYVCDTFPRTEWKTAFCVIAWESGGDPTKAYFEATGDWSVGLFQVNSDNLAGRNLIAGLRYWLDAFNDGHNYSVQEAMNLLFIPKWNVQAAYDIWLSEGWAEPWRAQRHRCDL